MLTREQKYAEEIYRQVESVSDDKKEDYLKMSKKLPVLIRSAGLTQALHFAVTRKGSSKQLVEDLAVAVGEADLLEQSRTANINQYIHLTEKCLTALNWYKRIAQSLLEL
ncbi:MAG: type III-B CRISPR module-associated protein Cmr5 [Pyrinomonadaceae bacterium]